MSDGWGFPSNSQSINRPFLLAFCKLLKKNLNTKDKQIRGDEVSLPNASTRSEVISKRAIDKDRVGNNRNTFHDSLNHIIGKSYDVKSVLYKVPLKPIISRYISNVIPIYPFFTLELLLRVCKDS